MYPHTTPGPVIRLIRIVLLALMALALLGGCDDRTGRGQLLGFESRGTVPAEVSQAMLDAYAPYGLYSLTVKYDVKRYKVSYRTIDYRGELTVASGLVTMPVKQRFASSPVISLQHGTLFLDVPPSTGLSGSQSVPEVSYADLATLLASQGYIVVAADYLGYGDSDAQIHPFTHADSLASATIDMLKAGLLLSLKNGTRPNGQLFLSGYSEGGYATLAMQRELESDPIPAMRMVASAPAAGPYDITTTAYAIMSSEVLPVPAYIGFIYKAYDTVYGWNRISDFFQATYVEAVNTSFDGTQSAAEINARLTPLTADLFDPAYRAAFLSGGELEVKTRLAENNLYNWIPQTMTRFFHGQDDVTVPYFNSVIAVGTMQAGGAADTAIVDCDLGGVAPTTHSNCFYPYFSYASGLFSAMATGL